MGKQTAKLAELLLRRKELQGKVDKLQHIIDNKVLFETVQKRVNVTEGVDDFVAKVPKLTASQVTAEYDFYARQLRLVDAAIQRTNWTADVEIDSVVMSDYVAPRENKEEAAG